MDLCSSAAWEQGLEAFADDDLQPLVSVVIPAFNAEATLRQTLSSVAAQDYPRLEILIVDDGSTDGTAGIAADFCATEPRARLLRKDNGGVASARNHAIAQARGSFVAPIDADDVWHPSKISRQVEAAAAAPEPPGFVYCWFRDTDEAGRVWRDGLPLAVEGCALQRLACTNFVGNGSAPLFSREALMAVGGYDERLRECGGGGCEDLLVQLQLARRFPVAFVPQYLVGYRLMAGSMSSDPDRMRSAWRQAMDVLDAKPLLSRKALRWSEGSRALLQAETWALRGKIGRAVRLLCLALRRDPLRTVLHLFLRSVRHVERRISRRRPVQLDFEIHDPAVASPVTDRWLEALTRFDQRRLEGLKRLERP